MKWKKCIVEEFKKVDIYTLVDTLSLILLGIFFADGFLHTTMFQLHDHTFFHQLLRLLMVLLILARASYNENRSNVNLVLMMMIIFCFSMAYMRRSRYEILIDSMLVILGAAHVEMKKIVKVYFWITGLLLLLTMAASQMGYVENLIYHRGDQIRIAFGIVYPTDFAAHVCYILWAYIYMRKKKLRYLEIALFAAVGMFIYFFCGARTSTICILLTALACLCLKMKKSVFSSLAARVQKMLAVLIVPLFSVFFIGLTVLYDPKYPLMRYLDTFFSTRLSLGKEGFTEYGVSLFGQFIPMVGAGGTVEARENYFFLDSSYVQIFLCYGILVMITVLVLYIVIGLRAIEVKDWYLVMIILMLALHCMIEHHMMEYYYNPFVLAVFAKELNCTGCKGQDALQSRPSEK